MSKNILTASALLAAAPILQLVPNNPTPGEIYLANEERFTSAFYSEPLTTYTVGWKDPNNLEGLMDFIAPPVQVGRRFEYKVAENTEAFLRDTDDVRALGSDFKTIEYLGSSVNAKTDNKGLTIRLDTDILKDMPAWREIYTQRLLQRLIRSELIRTLAVAVGLAGNTAKTWDTSSGKDPDQDILTEMITATDAAGVRPNRVVFGDVAWNKRLISHRAQATAGGFASASLTPQQLGSYLGVDGLQISRARYQSTASAKAKVVTDIVLLFYGVDGAGTDDPSHLKRFWSAAEGGGKYRVYEQQVSAKLVDLSVEHYSTIAATATVGIRKLTIS